MLATQDKLELTPAQARIWAGQRMHPDAPLYNMALAYRLAGKLSPEAFCAAFSKLVQEADALRLVIVEAGERATQTLSAEVPEPLDIIDLRSEPQPDDVADAIMRKRCRVRFDLTRQSWDSVLFRTGDTDWIWYFNQHHIFTDATSFAIMFRRLEELYLSCLGTGADETASLPRFAAHIAQPASQSESARAHFEQRLVSPPRLYGRASQRTTQSRRHQVQLGRKQAEALRQRATERPWAALTPQMAQFNLLATVLFAFLHRISGQDKVALGAPVHNRATPVARRTPGLLIDVLPMMVEVAQDDSFASLFEKVRAEGGLLLRHAMNAPDDAALQRSFNTVLNFITARMGSFSDLSVRSEWLHCGDCDANHQIRLHVEDFDGRGTLGLFMDLNCQAFPAPHAVVEQFSTLLDAFLTDPFQPIGSVPILSAGECERLAALGTGPEGGLETCPIPDLVAAQCAATPEATAIQWKDTALSYRSLGERVDTLAARLQAEGLKPGMRAALMLPRSPAAVVAMLAIMRCGAAYVPVDPATPSERRRLILEDADCAAIIELNQDHRNGIGVDLTGQPVSPASAALSSVTVSPDDTAYLLYTSGSTGKPKGVVVPHRCLSHYVGWARATYCGRKTLTFPLFTPLTFDLTVTSIFVPLISGGTIRIYQEAGPVDLAILDVVQDDAVDIVKLTPSHLRMLAGRDMEHSRIRQLIVGGEDLKTALALKIHNAFGGRITIHNEYGPTEATVGCVVHTFDPVHDRAGSVPIGRPIPNMSAHVLNQFGLPQPSGMAGELCLQGAGLAAGYHRRPELTAAAFVPTRDETGRMYRTGDLACVREDGVIEYLGRLDEQIKVNGVRIETGEIESEIMKLAGVDAACVVLRQRTGPDDRVVHCVRCGLPSNYPEAGIDGDGVCSICREFGRYHDSAQTYFRDMEELRRILATGLPSRGSHDCVVLFSGGKDSTYMLGRLAEMGLNVLAFTLDNGFISEQAKANIERVVTALGVDHSYGRVPRMNEIFADSLRQHSNVCNGCFKTIYTLGMQLALDRNIPFVFTGLSRGQFFETRLTAELFAQDAPPAEEIDAIVLEARKSYHRAEDAVSRCLDVRAFETDEIFEKVRVLDFYRYCDVGLDELYAWLDSRLPWVRPSDTGRSTNCRVNDVGIFVHKLERGFHNYALPYSWDVRLGHKDRDAALAELDDDLDEAEVARMLDEIGYRPTTPEPPQSELVAYYSGPARMRESDLRAQLAASLHDYMIPARFVHLDALPLSRNGKVDRAALPEPPQREVAKGSTIRPRTEDERRLAVIWEEVLGIQSVGLHDDYFSLGGDSISAVRINTRARKAGFELRPNDIFEASTIARLTALALSRKPEDCEVVPPGAVPLLPAQRWFLDGHDKMPPVESHVLHIETDAPMDRKRLVDALAAVVAHHDGLRTAFSVADGEWHAEILPHSAPPVVVSVNDAFDATLLRELNAELDPATARHVAAALRSKGTGSEAIILIHHLVTDAQSSAVFLEDLESALGSETLPRKTASIRRCATEIARSAETDAADWRNYISRGKPVLPASLASSSGATVAALACAQSCIDKNETAIARGALRRHGASLEQGLLVALSLSLGGPDMPDRLLVDVEKPGRTARNGQLDLGRTVGWLTAFVPLALPAPKDPQTADPIRVLADIVAEDEARPAVDPGAEFVCRRGESSAPTSPILFNLLDADNRGDGQGQLRQTKPLALWRDPDAPLRHTLTVNVSLHQDGIVIDWACPCAASVLEKLAEDYCRAFSRLLRAIGQSRKAVRVRPTDPANLDKLAALLRGTGASG